MNITAKTKICMTIGDPIEHSKSPQMHNAGLAATNLDGNFVYVAGHINISEIEQFIIGVRAMKLHFISCTIPHKIAVMQYLDEIDETAQKIGAVNSIFNDHGILKGSNTDWIGVVKSIEKRTSLDGKKVALIGAGGAARGAAYGVTSRGAKLSIYNRTIEKAEVLTKAFGGQAYSLKELEQVKDTDIIINTTSIGMQPNVGETPISKDYLSSNQIILDAVYTPAETRLLKEAQEKGATVIQGAEMFVEQAAAQFKLYTGHDAPIDAMRKAL